MPDVFKLSASVNDFSNSDPGQLAAACPADGGAGSLAGAFFKGVLEGAVFGAVIMGAVALAPEIGVFVALYGAYSMFELASNWNKMTPQQKAEALGGIVGGAAVGGAAGLLKGEVPFEEIPPNEEEPLIGDVGDTEPPLDQEPTSTPKTPPASKTIPKTYARPSGFRKGIRDSVWEGNKGSDGKVRDPTSGREMDPNEPWDMGHKPGFEFRKHQASAMERSIDRKQFLDEHNNPQHYRPELPSSNRSHAGENKTGEYFGD